MIRWRQAVDGFPDFGLTFGNPDFVKYAESYGAKGSRVTKCGDLAPTLEAAFKGGSVHLVVVPIDYSENKRVLVDELRAKVKPVEEPAEWRSMEGLRKIAGLSWCETLIEVEPIGMF